MTAIGYIRQSRRADLDVALSYDAQLAAIQRMAVRDGTDPDAVSILSDMGRSGGAGKEAKRPSYQAVLQAIEDGTVEVVYSLSLTRLARSTVELYRVAKLATEHGVRLVFAKEGVMDPTSPIGKAQFGTMAVFAEFERDLAVERARDNVAVRRSRGERMGRPPYGEVPGESVDVVLDAFRRKGSYNGAAADLNRAGIPTRLGRPWASTAVRLIVVRHAPDLAPRNPRRGAKASAPFMLYRLLRCSCDAAMTGFHDKGGHVVRYKCHRADSDPAHTRPKSVAETKLLPWVRSEAARLRVPSSVEVAADDARRDALAAKRDRYVDLYATGGIDRPTFDAKVAPLDEELARLPVAGRIVEVSRIDWETDEPGDVNAVLRAMWEYVELDAAMRPVRAEWWDRRLRAD